MSIHDKQGWARAASRGKLASGMGTVPAPVIGCHEFQFWSVGSKAADPRRMGLARSYRRVFFSLRGARFSQRRRVGVATLLPRLRLVATQFSRNTPFGGARSLSQNAPCRVSDLAPIAQVERLSSSVGFNANRHSERHLEACSPIRIIEYPR